MLTLYAHNVVSTSITFGRRRMNVKTTLCAYWVGYELFSSLYSFIGFFSLFSLF